MSLCLQLGERGGYQRGTVSGRSDHEHGAQSGLFGALGAKECSISTVKDNEPQSPPIEGAKLDHVALGVQAHSDAWERYVTQLGGDFWLSGNNSRFRAMQLAFDGQMRLELLEPAEDDQDNFLRRFLRDSGPGPHHLTFKVPDITAAIKRVEEAGYEPVGVSTERPEWKEAFLHPRQSLRVVIQLAQESRHRWPSTPPDGLPQPARPRAALLHVAHAVADRTHGLRLFSDLLGGVADGEGSSQDWGFDDLYWPDSGRLRLLWPSSSTSEAWNWLDGRTGRIHHIALAIPHPASIPGAHPLTETSWVVEPADNLGTRLLLIEPGAPPPAP